MSDGEAPIDHTVLAPVGARTRRRRPGTKPNALAQAETAIAAIESGTAREADVIQAINFMDLLSSVARQMKARLEAAAVAWIIANGEIEVGDIRYYVGTDRSYSCRNVKGAMEAILKSCDGDLEGVVACLSTSAWKPGTTRELIGQAAFDELFETRIAMDLATGKPRRGLKRADKTFAPSKENQHGTTR